MTDLAVRLASPTFDEEEIAELSGLLRAGRLAGGAEVAAFEDAFARTVGVDPETVVAVSSGTAALYLAGPAIGLEPAGTVLVPAFTFAATANAMTVAGYTVIPVDVDPVTMNMSPDDLRAALGEHPGARCVVVVDLYGSTSGTGEVVSVARDAGCVVIEDAAQAHGAEVESGGPPGRRADATTFSFYATKNVAAGEGGLVVVGDSRVGDSRVAELLRLRRAHGTLDGAHFVEAALNFRMTDLAAAMARLQLRRLDAANRARRANARALSEAFADAFGERVRTPVIPEGHRTHSFHQYTVCFATREERDATREHCSAAGVETKVFYPYVIGDLPGVTARPTPVASALCDTVLSFPVHPGLGASGLDIVIRSIRSAARIR